MKQARSIGSSVLPLATLAVAALALTSAGCSERVAEAATHEAAAVEVSAGSRADTDNYTVELKASGAAQVDKESSVELTLVPKGAYHINDKYPVKLKLADPPPEAGLKLPKLLFKREDGTFTEKSGSFKVPFVASRAGKATISGTFSFSVCSDANCMMDKVELAVDVDVK